MHFIQSPYRRTSRSLACSAALAALLLGSAGAGAQETPVPIEDAPATNFSARVLTTGLAEPWEMTWGPDEMLWLTERAGARVTRVDPRTGAKQILLEIEEVLVGPQHEGLLGMALHPELLEGTGNDYVYLAYTYDAAAEGDGEEPSEQTAEAPPTENELDRRAKIVRYTYDESAQQLVEPMELISGLLAWDDHNAGRMTIGPDMKLYYTTGELGGNQGRNFRNPIRSQELPTAEQVEAEDWSAYVGKTLRLELDGSIPEDNPEIAGVRSHVFTYGHRNPQGIDFGPEGTLYSVEHGPSLEDELNILQPGGNYGWPNVSGYQDDQAYTYYNWSEAPEDVRYNANNVPESVPSYPESEFEGENLVEPLATYFSVPDDFDFTAGCGWICNPTIAPSSVLYYEAGDNGISQWDNSVLITTLKHGSLYVQQLSEDGQEAEGLPVRYFNTQNRYRDLVIAPDNRTLFIATDASGTSSQLYGEEGFTNVLHNPGAILMFTYEGEGGTDTAGGGPLQVAPAPAVRGANADEAAAAGDGDTADQPDGAAETEQPDAAETEQADEATETEQPDGADAGTDAAGGDVAVADELMDTGRTVYAVNCSICHGRSGEGGQGVPLAGNSNLEDDQHVIDTILHGFGYMPPFEGRLDDAEIAAVATYIRNSWGNDFGPVQPEDVEAMR